jgi:hypothetical protein
MEHKETIEEFLGRGGKIRKVKTYLPFDASFAAIKTREINAAYGAASKRPYAFSARKSKR